MPELTILLDIDVSIASKRLNDTGKNLDRLDNQSRKFHETTRRSYLSLLEKFNTRIVKVDASKSIIQVVEDILNIMNERNII
jgi:dTMP kinase